LGQSERIPQTFPAQSPRIPPAIPLHSTASKIARAGEAYSAQLAAAKQVALEQMADTGYIRLVDEFSERAAVVSVNCCHNNGNGEPAGGQQKLRRLDYALYIYAFSRPAWLVPIREAAPKMDLTPT
jgi:hypothetical protein